MIMFQKVKISCKMQYFELWKSPYVEQVETWPLTISTVYTFSWYLPDVGGFMVSSSVSERGEALCESRYLSTNGCCIWLGNIPVTKYNVISSSDPAMCCYESCVRGIYHKCLISWKHVKSKGLINFLLESSLAKTESIFTEENLLKAAIKPEVIRAKRVARGPIAIFSRNCQFSYLIGTSNLSILSHLLSLLWFPITKINIKPKLKIPSCQFRVNYGLIVVGLFMVNDCNYLKYNIAVLAAN